MIKDCIERYEVHYCGKCPSKEYESEKSVSRKKRRKPRRRKSSLRISAKAKYIEPRTAFASMSGVTRVSPRSFYCSLGETVRLIRHPLYEKTQPSIWMAVFFGAGYGNRTRLCGLGSDRSTDELTCRQQYYCKGLTGFCQVSGRGIHGVFTAQTGKKTAVQSYSGLSIVYSYLRVWEKSRQAMLPLQE